MADGARIVGQDSGAIQIQVSMPADDHGFLGRQCPDCSQLFRVNAEDYQALPDEVELWCVYCGHHAAHSEFLTAQQLERAERALSDWAVQYVGQALDRSFRGMATRRPRSGFGIEISYRSRPFYPQSLPGINEEQLIRVRQCVACSLRYAVFGEHRYCPVCGLLPRDVVALDALAAETTRLDGLAHLPEQAMATLREQGVFHRIWVDTVENLVGAVEELASSAFHAAVPDAADRIKGKGNIFQRLDATADLFVEAGFADLRDAVDTQTWPRLRQVWAARHVFTHHGGMVDDKYLAAVPGSAVRVGQRLTLTEAHARQAIADVQQLCSAIGALTAP